MQPSVARATDAIKRLQSRREKTASDLLEAARRVISARGYARTKIVDIAREAGVGVGTFYLYYPTKQAILLKLAKDTARKLKEEMDVVRTRINGPASFARESTETFLRFAQENRELFRIVFSYGPDVHEVVKQAQEMFLLETIADIEAGTDAGVFRPNRPDVVAHAMIGLSMQVVSWWLGHQEIPIEQVTDAVTDFVSHGILTADGKATAARAPEMPPD